MSKKEVRPTMNVTKPQPLTVRKLAHPIAVRLARAGPPPTLTLAQDAAAVVVAVVRSEKVAA